MFGNLPATPSIGRRPKRHKEQTTTDPDGATALTQSLVKDLRQGLYDGLYSGSVVSTNQVAAATGITPQRPSIEQQATEQQATAPATTPPFPTGTPVRQVAMLAGESVTLTFSHGDGLVATPPEQGRILVLTNQRLMAFGQHEGMKETVVMPVEEVKAVAVNAGVRSKGSLIQGALMVVAAVFFYVLLAYWLTGRIDGPTVPVIRMDLVAFIVFLAVLSGVGMLAQMYFTKPDGEVTFQGDGVKVTFPFKGETGEEEVFQLVNAAFAARQEMVAKIGVRNSGAAFSGLTTT